MVFAGLILVPLIVRISVVQGTLPWLSNTNDTSLAILSTILMFVIPASRGKGGLILFGGGLTLYRHWLERVGWGEESVSGLSGLPSILILAITATVIIS